MKLNRNSSAETEAKQSDAAEVTTSSQPCGNTLVVRSPNVEATEYNKTEVIYTKSGNEKEKTKYFGFCNSDLSDIRLGYYDENKEVVFVPIP